MKRKYIIVTCVILISLFIGYKVYKKVQYNNALKSIIQLENANKNTQNALKIELRNNIKCDISQDNNNGNFVGYVYNNSIKDIEDMTIKISFYDNDNAKLGEQIIIINGLNHDEKYKINEMLWDKYKSAKTWKVTDKNITFTDSDYN